MLQCDFPRANPNSGCQKTPSCISTFGSTVISGATASTISCCFRSIPKRNAKNRKKRRSQSRGHRKPNLASGMRNKGCPQKADLGPGEPLGLNIKSRPSAHFHTLFPQLTSLIRVYIHSGRVVSHLRQASNRVGVRV